MQAPQKHRSPSDPAAADCMRFARRHFSRTVATRECNHQDIQTTQQCKEPEVDAGMRTHGTSKQRTRTILQAALLRYGCQKDRPSSPGSPLPAARLQEGVARLNPRMQVLPSDASLSFHCPFSGPRSFSCSNQQWDILGYCIPLENDGRATGLWHCGRSMSTGRLLPLWHTQARRRVLKTQHRSKLSYATDERLKIVNGSCSQHQHTSQHAIRSYLLNSTCCFGRPCKAANWSPLRSLTAVRPVMLQLMSSTSQQLLAGLPNIQRCSQDGAIRDLSIPQHLQAWQLQHESSAA